MAASLTPPTPLSVTLFIIVCILFARPTFSIDSPESPPSPSPQPPADDISPPPATPSPSPAPFNSPPAPPPSDLAPKSPAQAPSPGEHGAANKTSPSPAPGVAGHVRHEDQSAGVDLERKDEFSGGMSGGKKAGVAIGVIAGACVVGIGAVVYRKRKRNVQRSQYSYTGRREIL